MSDESKTHEQLLAEIAALKKQLAAEQQSQSAVTGTGAHEAEEPKTASAPVFATPVTRRAAITSWVAPVILSVPAVQTAAVLATVLPPRKAVAATRQPTRVPTAAPTGVPTAIPTRAPTAAPTAAPTVAGYCVPAPTVAPTLGMASTPSARVAPPGIVALGSASQIFVRLRAQRDTRLAA